MVASSAAETIEASSAACSAVRLACSLRVRAGPPAASPPPKQLMTNLELAQTATACGPSPSSPSSKAPTHSLSHSFVYPLKLHSSPCEREQRRLSCATTVSARVLGLGPVWSSMGWSHHRDHACGLRGLDAAAGLSLCPWRAAAVAAAVVVLRMRALSLWTTSARMRPRARAA